MSKVFDALKRLERDSCDQSTHFVDGAQEILKELGDTELAAPVEEDGGSGSTQFALALWYRLGLIEELVALAMAGYERSPWGGVEVGGVLFGTRDPSGVYVHCHRSLECKHELGPSFVLSTQDLDSMKRLLANARHDVGLKGLAPVGWYHSVSERELCLTEHDIALHDRFFPEPWQVAVTLKRSNRDPARVGFFLSEDNGFLRRQTRYTYTLAELRAKPPLAQTPEGSLWLRAS